MTFRNKYGLLAFTVAGKDIISNKDDTFELSETNSLVDTYIAKGMIEVVSKEVAKSNTIK